MMFAFSSLQVRHVTLLTNSLYLTAREEPY
jgi:hypothetical protein